MWGTWFWGHGVAELFLSFYRDVFLSLETNVSHLKGVCCLFCGPLHQLFFTVGLFMIIATLPLKWPRCSTLAFSLVSLTQILFSVFKCLFCLSFFSFYCYYPTTLKGPLCPSSGMQQPPVWALNALSSRAVTFKPFGCDPSKKYI